jgi:hypothetical protein
MPLGATCKGQLGLGDIYFVDIEKSPWRDDDQRIKDTSKNQPQGREFTATQTETTEKPAKPCGCNKAKKQGE